MNPAVSERELQEETNRRSEELFALLAVTDGSLSTLKLDELMDALLERLLVVMRADAGAILLETEDGLVVQSERGFAGRAAERPPIPFGKGVGGLIATTGEPLYVEDARTDPRVLGTFLPDQGVVSMLGVPLTTRNELVGVLHVDWKAPHPEDPRERRLLEVAAERCAAAIVNARLVQGLREVLSDAHRVKDRLSLALSAADLGVWDWDVPSGRVVWDAHNERIFGLAPGTYDGSYETFESFVHPEDLPGVKTAIAAALDGASYRPSFRIRRRDGELRWIAALGRLQRGEDGRPLRLLGITADVTDEHRLKDERERLLSNEKAARREAESAQRQIVNVLERVTDAFVALDTDWRYTYVSRKAAEIFGRTPEELVGRHIWTEFPEGVGQPFYRAYHRAAEEQVPIQFEEYYPPYDRWFENRIYPSPDGLSIFFSDITDRKRTDERLKVTNEQLRALSARVQHVREEEAARISREIHDELGQLLTALRLDVAGLEARFVRLGSAEREALAPKTREMAGLIDRTIEWVQRISEELRPGLLDALGLEAAVDALLDGVKARSGLATSLSGSLGEKRLPAPVEIGAYRIVQELLTNVVRHAAASSVTVALSLDGGRLSIEVADDGRGIREAELLSPRSLGLAGLRERVRLLDGTVEVRPREGGGTEARVVVPVETRT